MTLSVWCSLVVMSIKTLGLNVKQRQDTRQSFVSLVIPARVECNAVSAWMIR
ncbi:MAG: hypothetical protein AAFQ58_16340 [Pseudomonadota bacterium]